MQKNTVFYYTSPRGENPVREFINSLEDQSKAKIHHIFELIKQYGIAAATLHVRKLIGFALWEIRTVGRDNIRILYVTVAKDSILVLHGFIKKSQKTPRKEIVTALNRYREWFSRFST